MKRTKMRCGAGSKRRGKSSFPKQRDKAYRDWIRLENECMLQGGDFIPTVTLKRFSLHDVAIQRPGDDRTWWIHRCWGPIDPAHVGDTQARGAPDFGVIVPLCRIAHRRYDNRRWEWKKVTGFSEEQMVTAASGYALKYCERGGSSTPQGAT